jgi:hypothetical protein
MTVTVTSWNDMTTLPTKSFIASHLYHVYPLKPNLILKSFSEDISLPVLGNNTSSNKTTHNNESLRLTPQYFIDQQVRYHCSHCSVSCKTKSSMLIHLGIHLISVRNYKCKICAASFLIQANLDRHVADHPDDVSELECHICLCTFSTQNKLRLHILSHSRCVWRRH